jgi:hypothetical protein
MLPTVVDGDPNPPYTAPAYLVEAASGAAWPYPTIGSGFERNTFLEALNTNIGLLSARLGNDNIYVLHGRRTQGMSQLAISMETITLNWLSL